jgi:hypothetical protein
MEERAMTKLIFRRGLLIIIAAVLPPGVQYASISGIYRRVPEFQPTCFLDRGE